MIREFVKDNQVAVVVVGVCVTAVTIAIIVTGGDLAAFGEFFAKLF